MHILPLIAQKQNTSSCFWLFIFRKPIIILIMIVLQSIIVCLILKDYTRIMKALELFGQNLKKLRKSKDLTQEQLGEQLNLSRNQINNYENAMFEPSMETLLQISSFFNVSLDLLCNGYSDTNDVLLRNTLEEVQQTYAALEEPKRERFCKQLAFYSKVLAETDELL